MPAPLGYNSHNYYPDPPNYNFTFYMIINLLFGLFLYGVYLHGQIIEIKQLCSS